jgi:beta-ribofuranosylaminobenzene 5'-phosphate synthase
MLTRQLDMELDRVSSISVLAPARLHLGFLDLHGGLGRRYGSVGVAIEGVGVHLHMEPAAAPSATGPSAARALEALHQTANALNLAPNARITIIRSIPEHAGFGSGTQLGLAVATALAHLHRLAVAPDFLARAVGRGKRSGIGIAAFEHGGFLVDGGHGAHDAPAPLIARLHFPEAWRIVLVLDPARIGLHGKAENAAFGTLPLFSEALAAHLCRVLVMRLLPGVAEADFIAVSSAINDMQDRLGEYFAMAQNGRYSSPTVARVLAWLRAHGLTGIGQSSWGPTGFCFTDSEERARDVVKALTARTAEWPDAEFLIVRGNNHGATIEVFSSREDDGL